MKLIAIAQFKTKCHSLLDKLGPEGLIITKHGKPIARILPAQTESTELIGDQSFLTSDLYSN